MVLAALLVLALGANATNEPGDPLPPTRPPVYGIDRARIAWVLPGDFELAFARARCENRILLIKTVSFGIDDLGASDATKGRW